MIYVEDVHDVWGDDVARASESDWDYGSLLGFIEKGVYRMQHTKDRQEEQATSDCIDAGALCVGTCDIGFLKRGKIARDRRAVMGRRFYCPLCLRSWKKVLDPHYTHGIILRHWPRKKPPACSFLHMDCPDCAADAACRDFGYHHKASRRRHEVASDRYFWNWWYASEDNLEDEEYYGDEEYSE